MSNTNQIEKLLSAMSADQLDELEAAMESIKQKKNIGGDIKHNNQSRPEEKPRKNRRKPRKKSGQPGLATQKRRIITQETASMHNGTAPRQKAKRASEGRRRSDRRNKAGGSPCRVEPISVSGERPNLFLQSKLKNKHKADSAIDKKLLGNNEVTEREDTRLIEVECADCHYIFDVSPKVIFKEDGEIRYVCDDCRVKRSSKRGR
jgi:hypothetical protein